MTAFRAAQLVSGLGALLGLGFLLDAADLGRPERWPVLGAFALWTLAPWALLAWAAQRLRARGRAARVLLLAAALLAAASAFLLHQTFVVHPDPQSPIALVFLPLYQLVALAPFLALAGSGWARAR
jgi:hypothetical protein